MSTAYLGFVFLVLSFVTTFLMFQFWGYPYDEEKKKSSCPQWKMNIHRFCGFAYVVVYLILMWQMVPRLWQYQVEFPARTVAHIIFGITIGVILIVKLSILRWFRHFEEMMPTLGIALLLCTCILTGLSLPSAAKEQILATNSVGGSVFSTDNRQRVVALLPSAGFPQGTDFTALTTEASLQHGREVLLTKCTFCHDLKTVIAKPRTPKDWVRTVNRMAAKPTLGQPIAQKELQQVAAYLIAITPDLQKSSKAKRANAKKKSEAMKAAKAATAIAMAPTETNKDNTNNATAESGKSKMATIASYDAAKAKEAFEDICSQCHETSDVDETPPGSQQELTELIERMIENGLEAEKEEMTLIREYLTQTFVNKQGH